MQPTHVPDLLVDLCISEMETGVLYQVHVKYKYMFMFFRLFLLLFKTTTIEIEKESLKKTLSSAAISSLFISFHSLVLFLIGPINTIILIPVSYTHLTLPTIYSV